MSDAAAPTLDKSLESAVALHSINLQAPDDEKPPEQPLEDASTLHAEMLRRISSLEEVMAQLLGVSSGIGHNHPLEPIKAFPVTVADQIEITVGSTVLCA